MTQSIDIQHYPLFEKGLFEKNPALFDPYLRNTPAHLKKRYQKARETLPEYEVTPTWPVIAGPGFCGATHPGAEKTFNEIMVGPNKPVYNSDCLYLNPSQRIFAISDPPGMTTAARNLFAKLDQEVQTKSIGEIETIINDLNKATGNRERATLSLIYLPESSTDHRFDQALAFVAGDTFVFHGNIHQKTMTRIHGSPDFMGTPHMYFKPQLIDLSEGDFFIIASDGITSIRGYNNDTKLEDALWDHVNGNPEAFAFNITQITNSIQEEMISNGVISRFGGSDDVSVLLVYPEKLVDTDCGESYVLGGYIGEKLA